MPPFDPRGPMPPPGQYGRMAPRHFQRPPPPHMVPPPHHMAVPPPGGHPVPPSGRPLSPSQQGKEVSHFANHLPLPSKNTFPLR